MGLGIQNYTIHFIEDSRCIWHLWHMIVICFSVTFRFSKLEACGRISWRQLWTSIIFSTGLRPLEHQRLGARHYLFRMNSRTIGKRAQKIMIYVAMYFSNIHGNGQGTVPFLLQACDQSSMFWAGAASRSITGHLDRSGLQCGPHQPGGLGMIVKENNENLLLVWTAIAMF